MLITFCGQPNNGYSQTVKEQILNLFEREVGFCVTKLFFVQVGPFEKLVLSCVNEIKEKFTNITCCFVSVSSRLNKVKKQVKELFDEIIVLRDLEKCNKEQKDFALQEWLIDNSNIIASYVNYNCGFVYSLLCSGIDNNKRCYNFGNCTLKKHGSK